MANILLYNLDENIESIFIMMQTVNHMYITNYGVSVVFCVYSDFRLMMLHVLHCIPDARGISTLIYMHLDSCKHEHRLPLRHVKDEFVSLFLNLIYFINSYRIW
jgi:hypothetical protein